MDDSQQILTRMLMSTINAREVESNRVSRALHDDVGQVLSAVGLQLGVLKLDYQSQIPELTDRINEIQGILDQAVRQVRALSYDLNPAVVERAGLQNSLDRLVERYREEFKGSVRFLYDSAVRVPLQVGNAWYKIAELALENAATHSQASRIEVHVRPAARVVALEVRDNGVGFKPQEIRLRASGLGLLLMEHYATQAGLELAIKSTPGKGTNVRTSYTIESERRPSPQESGSAR